MQFYSVESDLIKNSSMNPKTSNGYSHHRTINNHTEVFIKLPWGKMSEKIVQSNHDNHSGNMFVLNGAV